MAAHKHTLMLIDGRTIAERLHEQTAREVALLKESGVTPKLAVILVGDDAPSTKYVQMKEQAAKKAGIDFILHRLPADVSKAAIINDIKKLQEDTTLSGLIVQLPLPEPLFTTDVLNAIDPARDIECLTDANIGRLVMRTNIITPPTAGAVMHIIDTLQINLAGKEVCIVGAGMLVGKPLSIMMMNKEATVTTCNIHTKNIQEKCLIADIIVTGVGKPHIVTADMVRPDAVVIDTGIWFDEQKKVHGDTDWREISEKGASVTPTPGGVGPVTVSYLLHNTVLCAKARQ